jgi:hypothetical protein
MANFRIPGPLCSSRTPWSLDDGTLPRSLTPLPGIICASSPTYPTMWLQQQRAQPGTDDLAFLFRECRNPVRGLSAEDFEAAAKTLDVDAASIQAVAEVETSGNAFDDSGRPRILFERHYFHRQTGGRYDAKHASISNARSGGYGKFSAQYTKLEEAYRLAPEAALRSASWGRFQIMGDNFKAAGYASVSEFVLAMTRAEAEHLKAFSNFVLSHKSMHAALKKQDWAAFARAYNGPGYKANKYDTKLSEAYQHYSEKQSTEGAKKP